MVVGLELLVHGRVLALLNATSLLSTSARSLAGEIARLATSGRLGLSPLLSLSLSLDSSSLELLLEELLLVASLWNCAGVA